MRIGHAGAVVGVGSGVMGAEQGQGLAAAFDRLYERMTPEQREAADRKMADSVTAALKHALEMRQVLLALKLLHRPGTGERAGFCGECGNVTPCQTVKFIEPVLDGSELQYGGPQ